MVPQELLLASSLLFKNKCEIHPEKNGCCRFQPFWHQGPCTHIMINCNLYSSPEGFHLHALHAILTICPPAPGASDASPWRACRRKVTCQEGSASLAIGRSFLFFPLSEPWKPLLIMMLAASLPVMWGADSLLRWDDHDHRVSRRGRGVLKP